MKNILKLNILGYDCKFLSKSKEDFGRCRKKNIICLSSCGCPNFKMKLSDKFSALKESIFKKN